jgi:galactose mutarotase-like enzyme
MKYFFIIRNALINFIIFLFSIYIHSNSNYIKNDTLILQNEFLQVKIKKKGAEIISVFNKKKTFEHIWQADKKSWNQNAPILFPIVGKLKDGLYKIDNKIYNMKNHGFANYSNFKLISKSKNEVVLELTSTKQTLKEYPYKFKLVVKYTLLGNKVSIENTVKNIDSQEIYFSIGAHPGFNIPLNSNEKYNDYYLEFNQNETVSRLPLTKKKGLLSNNSIENYLDNSNKLKLNHKMFKDRAVILQGLKSSTVEIKSNNSDMSVKVGIENFPFLGIWTTSKSNEPYICIEPWFGISDNIDSNGDFKKKKGIQSLAIAKVFKMKYFIQIENKK